MVSLRAPARKFEMKRLMLAEVGGSVRGYLRFREGEWMAKEGCWDDVRCMVEGRSGWLTVFTVKS